MEHTPAFGTQLKIPGKRLLIALTCGAALGMALEILVSGATGLGITGFALIGLGIGCCSVRKK